MHLAITVMSHLTNYPIVQVTQQVVKICRNLSPKFVPTVATIQVRHQGRGICTITLKALNSTLNPLVSYTSSYTKESVHSFKWTELAHV